MPTNTTRISARSILIWVIILAVMTIPFLVAAFSPLLQWRSNIYIIAGFAGVTGMAIMVLQPLAICNLLPGISSRKSRKLHKWIGLALVAAILLHVIGLYFTSPPDVIDALTFNSPTPFSAWGVTAMWAVFITAFLAALRRPLKIRPAFWRIAHISLAIIIVTGTVVHAVLIEGTMETYTKLLLSAVLFVATVWMLLQQFRR